MAEPADKDLWQLDMDETPPAGPPNDGASQASVEYAAQTAGDWLEDQKPAVKEALVLLASQAGSVASVLNSVDQNHDGVVGVTELHEKLSALGLGFQPGQLRELFDVIDTDSSGRISSDELSAALTAVRAARSDQMLHHRISMQHQRTPAVGQNPVGMTDGYPSTVEIGSTPEVSSPCAPCAHACLQACACECVHHTHVSKQLCMRVCACACMHLCTYP